VPLATVSQKCANTSQGSVITHSGICNIDFRFTFTDKP